MLNLHKIKAETWSVEHISGVNDQITVFVSSESAEVLDSDAILKEITELATLDGHGRYLWKSRIRTHRDGAFKRSFYFQMSKCEKLKKINNEEELPDEIVYVEGPIRTLHVLNDQTLSEKKAFHMGLIDVYGDKFISVTILHRNNSEDYWERENIYLNIDDFMNIAAKLNLALADSLTQYQTESSIRDLSELDF